MTEPTEETPNPVNTLAATSIGLGMAAIIGVFHGARQRRLRVRGDWPWATQIAEAFGRIMIIPAPT